MSKIQEVSKKLVKPAIAVVIFTAFTFWLYQNTDWLVWGATHTKAVRESMISYQQFHKEADQKFTVQQAHAFLSPVPEK